MSDLLAYQNNLQAITELINHTLGVDVFVVDDGMVAIAGTGSYRSNIGTRRPHDSYVDVTLNRGDGQTVINPPGYPSMQSVRIPAPLPLRHGHMQALGQRGSDQGADRFFEFFGKPATQYDYPVVVSL